MEFFSNEKYKFYGRVDAENVNSGVLNYSISLTNDEIINVKVLEGTLKIGDVYLLEFECQFNGTRNVLTVTNATPIFECALNDELYEVFKKYFSYVSVGIPALEAKLDDYLSSIKNPVIKALCDDIFARYRHDFLIYPAAVKMHHNYLGGLAYHSLTMCDLAKAFTGIYDSVDLDLLIGGALLHDVSKVIEFKGPTETEYSVKGQLVGHLVLGAIELEKTAIRLGLENEEEVLLLQHMLLSHHGQPIYGAAKKPEIPEALLLWYLDSIDSKLRVIDETFEHVLPGTFSEGIGVVEKMKFYKRK